MGRLERLCHGAECRRFTRRRARSATVLEGRAAYLGTNQPEKGKLPLALENSLKSRGFGGRNREVQAKDRQK